MPLWDYIHFGRASDRAADEQHQQYRNLQEGLMQIASQTCNILVQVNNTNNISYGHNATNVQYNNFSPNHDIGFAGGGRGAAGGRSQQHQHQHQQHNGGRGGGGGVGASSRSGRHSRDDEELSDVLIPAAAVATASVTALGIRGSTKNLFSHYRHRLSVSGGCGGAGVADNVMAM